MIRAISVKYIKAIRAFRVGRVIIISHIPRSNHTTPSHIRRAHHTHTHTLTHTATATTRTQPQPPHAHSHSHHTHTTTATSRTQPQPFAHSHSPHAPRQSRVWPRRRTHRCPRSRVEYTKWFYLSYHYYYLKINFIYFSICLMNVYEN